MKCIHTLTNLKRRKTGHNLDIKKHVKLPITLLLTGEKENAG